MKTILLILSLAVTAVAAAYAVRAINEIGQARTAAAELMSNRSELHTRVNEVEEQCRTAEAACADLKKEVVAAEAARKVAPQPSPTPTRRLSPEAVLVGDPKLLAAYAQDLRAGLDASLGPTARLVGLTPAQLGKLKALKADSDERLMKLRAAAEAKGLGATNAAAVEAYRAAERDENAARTTQEAGILGDRESGYREAIRNFNATQPVRTLVRRLASSEIYPDTPLTAAQVEHVTQILADNSQRSGNGAVIRFTVNWEAANGSLNGVLSPSQLESLRDIHRQMELVQQSQKELDRVLAQLKSTLPKS